MQRKTGNLRPNPTRAQILCPSRPPSAPAGALRCWQVKSSDLCISICGQGRRRLSNALARLRNFPHCGGHSHRLKGSFALRSTGSSRLILAARFSAFLSQLAAYPWSRRSCSARSDSLGLPTRLAFSQFMRRLMTAPRRFCHDRRSVPAAR